MGKIIKSNLETVQIKKEKFTLGMKGKFTVEFVNDTFGPYDYKFAREDCYYIDGLEERGSVAFPLKNKEFQNTEIFLENDDIIICIGERTNLSGEAKSFIDVINIKTEKKQRIITDEVNLIYNAQKDIIINANLNGIFKTLTLDGETLDIIEEKEEKLLAFFKYIINIKTKQNFRLKQSIEDGKKYFVLDLVIESKIGNINNYNREYFKINGIGIWHKTFIKAEIGDIDFFDNQKYIISRKKKNLILSQDLAYKIPFDGKWFGILFISIILSPLFSYYGFILIMFAMIMFFYKSDKKKTDYIEKRDILVFVPFNKGYDDKYEIILKN